MPQHTIFHMSHHSTPHHSTALRRTTWNQTHNTIASTPPHTQILPKSYPFASIWIRHPGFNNPWNSGGGRRVSDGRNRYENFRHNKQDLYRNGSDQSISSRSTRENTHIPRKRVSRDEGQQYGNQKRYRRSKSTIDDTILWFHLTQNSGFQILLKYCIYHEGGSNLSVIVPKTYSIENRFKLK